ncbi:hydrolase 1, exosortase A system-associated [Thiospirillum jenense]|uniref:Hydrolase 1, exosortase A system-associated n=1 Tax=Thiospirillum jenense TaxID=1653858 RepID=A0A839HED3_9GAMM|nr:hydrolase 1, exosortase A system-associated [Thiospirillum jenense]MBB1125369.1 hydrolase 1, exosortase A system-associated [Thiospirillum jenense]
MTDLTFWVESPHVFVCDGLRLIGVSCVPKRIKPTSTGVLFIIGGPQYRAGTHRQITLLARQFASAGIASFRFDYRGMGDSEGEMRSFEFIETDISSAIKQFISQVTTVKTIALWGLCDAASAALCYAYKDGRVKQLILLNPWVHDNYTEALARLRRYYPARLFARDFWYKTVRLQLNISNIYHDLLRFIQQFKPFWMETRIINTADFISQMLMGLEQFNGKILVILSHSDDSTVAEFLALLATNHRWLQAIQRGNVTCYQLESANHNFSRQEWRENIAIKIIDWLVENNNADIYKNSAQLLVMQQHEQT